MSRYPDKKKKGSVIGTFFTTLLLIASSYSNPINGLLAAHFDRTVVIDPRYWAEWAGEPFDPERCAAEQGATDLLLLGDIEFFLQDLAGAPAASGEGGGR